MRSEEECRRARLERVTELLSRSTRLAIESARMAREHAELVAELALEPHVERKGPQPAGAARVVAMRRAG